MKRIRSILLAIAAIVVSSCATKSDIDSLQGQIDELKSGKIATIEQQMSNIQASLTSLQATDTQLSSFVSSLQLETSNVKADLTAKEKALSDRIDALKKYADEELAGAKDWVSATFTTLEQYQAVLTSLEEIRQSLKDLDDDLRAEIESAISASEESMKGWVSEQLAGYYTIAQMDVKLNALTDADTVNGQAIDKVASDLETAKAELTEAYSKAITDAITKYDGAITAKVAADIKAATDVLNARIDALEDRVAALEGMIQSATIIPDYSDGSVKVSSSGKLSLSCILSPSSAVKGLTKDNVRLYIANTVTKASGFSIVEPSKVIVDESTGSIEIIADLASMLPADNQESLAVAVNVKSDKADYTSSFVKVNWRNYAAEPFTITSSGNASVSIAKYGSPNEISLEYRVGEGLWCDYTIGSSVDLSDGEYVQFRNKGTGHFSNSFVNYYRITVAGEGRINASGNIMSLLDSEMRNITLDEFEFYGLFEYCQALTDAYNLVLPATTLASHCYYAMFSGCTSLTTAPALPATTLAEDCYGGMFGGCTSLISAPELPSITLADECYYAMFSGCTSLTTAPELPATTLADDCYVFMFYGCTNLKSAPALPATTLADNCYEYMFYDCTSLTTAPELPATTLADYCYAYMFYGCTSLTSSPALPATTLADACYYSMFSGCTNLSYVKADFTSYTSDAIRDWLSGVSSTGTFVKSKNATWSNSGIVPSGWTVLTE